MRTNRWKPRTLHALLILLLSIVIPTALLANLQGDIRLSFVLAWLIAVYAGVRIADLSIDVKHSFLQLTHWMFVYCWFGLAGSAQIKTDNYPWWSFKQTESNLVVSCAAIILGLAAYELAVRRKPKVPFIKPGARVLRNPSLRRYLFGTTVCVGLSLWGLQSQGGLGSAFKARFESGNEELSKAGSLVASTLQHSGAFVALLLTLYLLGSNRHKVNRLLLRTILVLLVLYNLVANYPPSLSRVTLGSELLAGALLLACKNTKYKPLVSIATILGLIFVFPYMDFFRSADGYEWRDVEKPTEPLINKPDYDAFQMMSNAVAAAEDGDFTYGRNLLGSALFFLPRELWRGKPWGTGQQIGEELQYPNTNLSCPLWAELYFSGGIVAVVIGFGLYGKATLWLEKAASESPELPGYLFMCYAAGFQIFLLRGDLQNAIAYSAPSYIMLAGFFAYRRGKTSKASSPVPLAEVPPSIVSGRTRKVAASVLSSHIGTL